MGTKKSKPDSAAEWLARRWNVPVSVVGDLACRWVRRVLMATDEFVVYLGAKQEELGSYAKKGKKYGAVALSLTSGGDAEDPRHR